ncbi:MAG: DNA topoisomerase IV subunit A, partial [Deltaproteobacteria bacterium]|nr:DNA topoisomerase IV subunit A [Deltaproteobacteria bacterium]
MTQLSLLPPALTQGTASSPPAEPPSASRPAAGGGGEDVLRGDLAEEARRKYLNYALSVITARAIPDVRDGLKPVARRILFTMFHELRLVHDGRHRKSAKVVGDVIGKYHPHGDGAVYDAMVRLAQDFVMRAPLVDGHGNFGSIDGDSPAAYRYTEARLSEISGQLLTELSKETVEFRDTFDGTGREPIVLPARFPQLLVNGGTGIAVGMATAIPPHNLGEVIKACMALIDTPDLSVKQLMRWVKGPDFPTGGELVAKRADIAAVYQSGKGSFKLRGRWKLEQSKEGPILVITEVPHGVEKAALVEEIGQIILARKLPVLIGVQDLSTTDIRVELALDKKSTIDPELVMAYLFKHTRLQVSVKVDFTVLVPTDNPEVGAPARLDLAQILRHFLDFRFATVKRRLEYELRVLERRIHILEGFEIIFDALDKAIRIIRNSDGKADAAAKLMKAFKIDDEQADAVLETKLYRLAKLEIEKIRAELADKRKKAKALRAILRSKAKLWALVKKEMAEVAEQFADSRRTKLGADDLAEEFSAESFIVEEDAVVLVTRDGWIKRQRTINLETTRMREGDEPLALVGGTTRECVVLLTNMGSAYVCRINDVTPSTGHGTPVQKLFKFKDGERVVWAVGTDPRVMPEFAEPKPELGEEYEEPYPHLLAVTRQGQSLRFALWPHKEPSTSRGRMFARLSKGDEIVSVFKAYVEDTICGLTRGGRLLACEAGEVNLLSGPGKGVRLLKLDAGDEIAAAFLADTPVVIEKTSGGKQKLTGDERKPVARGGKG